MKTKFERQFEAQERKLRTLPKRRERLLAAVLYYHAEGGLHGKTDWSFNRLKKEVEGFHAFLREVDLPSGDHSFVVYRNSVVLRDPNVIRVGGCPGHQCVYCQAAFNTPHQGLCDTTQTVGVEDAIFKDCDAPTPTNQGE